MQVTFSAVVKERFLYLLFPDASYTNKANNTTHFSKALKTKREPEFIFFFILKVVILYYYKWGNKG
jgi:hypothetical protein